MFLIFPLHSFIFILIFCRRSRVLRNVVLFVAAVKAGNKRRYSFPKKSYTSPIFCVCVGEKKQLDYLVLILKD